MELTGKLHKKYDEVIRGEDFRTRLFVLQYADNPTYPQFITFELVKDRCDLINSIELEQEITVRFNINGRQYIPAGSDETKYFNSLQAWKIDVVEQPSAPEPSILPVF